MKLAYSRWAFYTLYECVKFSDISNSHNALLIMLNFLVNHLLEYESIVSAVMICLTYENQKLTRAHTHCDLLKSLNIRVIISNASLRWRKQDYSLLGTDYVIQIKFLQS